MRTRLVLMMLAGLMVAACEPETADEPMSDPTPLSELPAMTPEPESGMSMTVTVDVDGKVPDLTASYLAYFPSKVEVHPGDTVNFDLIDTGDPHTVTFGTLIDAAAAQYEAMGPFEGEASEEAQALPMFGPEDELTTVYQSAVQPCFLASGSPGTDACSADEQVQGDFTGEESYYNSGWMAPESTFSVTFSPDIAPGTYSYLCIVHRGSMIGTVTVVPADTPVPGPDEVEAAGAEELNALADTVRASAAEFPAPEGNTVQSGLLFETVPNVTLNEFLPREITISAGDSVTWNIMGPHTISFNAPEDANTLRVEAADGSVTINPLAAEPMGGPGMPPPPEEDMSAEPDPDAPPPPPIEIDGGSWDGAGPRSSGFVFSFPPGPMFSYKVTFETPGTYPYRCLIHPDLEGRVTVE